MKTYIVGHRNPDTDSIVSAIALEALEKELGKAYRASRAGEINKETKFVLDKFGVKKPELILDGEKEVILVDHNEPGQIHENIKTEEIVGIFDHHKLGGLITPFPVSVRMKTVGATATIISSLFNSENIKPTKEIASILICAILSDTLKFTSPTTTREDEKAVEELNKIAEINLDEIAQDMFEAKSDISDVSTEELVSKDYKIFDMSGKKVGIGVWETVNIEVILDRKVDILGNMKKLREKENLSLVYFVAVDILAGNSELFIVGEEEEEIAKKAFNQEVLEGVMSLPGVVSRKKQITPIIEGALKQL